MKLPWVDREELMGAMLKIATLELELEHSRRLAAIDAAKIEALEAKVKSLEQLPHNTPAPPSMTSLPIGARPRITDVIAEANRKAEENALAGGPAIMNQLAEARQRMARIKARVNGR